MASFVNFDFSRGVVNTIFQHGFAPEFVESYRRRYAAHNPWTDFWLDAPSGYVGISERDSPASAFRNSEFYIDWLAPQGNAEAAVGLKIDVDADNSVKLAWHYDLSLSPDYDEAGAGILAHVRPAVAEAVRAADILRSGLEKSARLGEMIEHIDGIAIMLDKDCRIREANVEAAEALIVGDVLNGSADILQFRDPAATRWLEEAVASLLDETNKASTTASFSGNETVFRATLTRAPYFADSHAALLVAPRPQALLVVKVLVGRSVRIAVTDLQLAFGLSGAESRLCEMLVNGISLAEAAKELRVSEGTVRQRVKMIFNKTGTHRQGELVALLARFRIAG